MRAEGLTAMPMHGDVRSATVPGCVDGWLALHERFGRLPLAEVLAPARDYAENGFPASPLLARASGATRCGWPAPTTTCRPAVCTPATGSVARWWHWRWTPSSRTAGPVSTAAAFGDGLLELGGGLFTADDLDQSLASWEDPLRVTAWDREIWTVPPPSQGYLTLAGARIADGLDLPDDPDDSGLGAPTVRGGAMGRPRPGLRVARRRLRALPARRGTPRRPAARRSIQLRPHRTHCRRRRPAAPFTCASSTTTGWASR